MTRSAGEQQRRDSGVTSAASAPQPPWRSVPKRGRSAPRPQLSRAVVVTAALQVVETEGGDALTMRRIADEIGVSASSLYGYVANKEEL
ncbi:MAG: TetR/AcrR family transcriptional regulator, partial [Streptosporangiaceae bacterium]